MGRKEVLQRGSGNIRQVEYSSHKKHRNLSGRTLSADYPRSPGPQGGKGWQLWAQGSSLNPGRSCVLSARGSKLPLIKRSSEERCYPFNYVLQSPRSLSQGLSGREIQPQTPLFFIFSRTVLLHRTWDPQPTSIHATIGHPRKDGQPVLYYLVSLLQACKCPELLLHYLLGKCIIRRLKPTGTNELSQVTSSHASIYSLQK